MRCTILDIFSSGYCRFILGSVRARRVQEKLMFNHPEIRELRALSFNKARIDQHGRGANHPSDLDTQLETSQHSP